MVTAEDVARAIIFLCSDISSHITGQVIKVDGGRSLTSAGWFPYDGKANLDTPIEPSVPDKLSNLKSLFIMDNKPSNTIEQKLKITQWSTTDRNAHILIKGANYKVAEDYKQQAQSPSILESLSTMHNMQSPL